MSSLPQRKKTAEEIAQLRENLGISSPAAAAAPAEPAIPAREEASAKPLVRIFEPTVEVQPVARDAVSGLPLRRRSAEQIEEMRRRELLAPQEPPALHPKFVSAHPALISAGYLFAAGSAGCLFLRQLAWLAAALCIAIALCIALSIFLRCPVSTHHAGFIAIIATLVLVFGSLHLFPQLHHAP
jgi:hypothetical protein